MSYLLCTNEQKQNINNNIDLINGHKSEKQKSSALEN